MLGQYVRPARTIITKLEACVAYWDACTSLGMKPTIPLVTVLVAHGALETGHFESCWLYNVGNIKAGGSWTGKYTCLSCNEILKAGGPLVYFTPQGELTGNPKYGGKLKTPYDQNPLPVPEGHPQTRFRAYDSLAQGVEDKIRFLLKPYWEPVLKPARLGDVSTYVRMIRIRNYFTAYRGQPDPTRYETDVISLTKTYRTWVEKVWKGERPVVKPLEPEAVVSGSKFIPDDDWRTLAFKAYDQALAMDVHEMVRKESMRELSDLEPISKNSNEDEIS